MLCDIELVGRDIDKTAVDFHNVRPALPGNGLRERMLNFRVEASGRDPYRDVFDMAQLGEDTNLGDKVCVKLEYRVAVADIARENASTVESTGTASKDFLQKIASTFRLSLSQSSRKSLSASIPTPRRDQGRLVCCKTVFRDRYAVQRLQQAFLRLRLDDHGVAKACVEIVQKSLSGSEYLRIAQMLKELYEILKGIRVFFCGLNAHQCLSSYHEMR